MNKWRCKKSLEIAKGQSEGQTTQWPKEKQKPKDKQRSTKQTHKTKDRATRTPLKTGVNISVLYQNMIFFHENSKSA